MQSANDILNEIHQTTSFPSKHLQPELSPKEQRIWDALYNEPIHIDVLAKQADYTIGETLDTLLNLEIQNNVEKLSGMSFRKRT